MLDPNTEVIISVGSRSYDMVKHQGPPAAVNGGELLLIHPTHFEALVRASVRNGVMPFEDTAWSLGCH